MIFNHYLLAAASLVALTGAKKDHPDFQTFETEPHSRAMRYEIKKNTKPDALAHGNIFISPYQFAQGWGPQIFTDDGELVWDGHETAKFRAMDCHPCLVNGSYDHLCYKDAYPIQQGGHSSGVIRFFDNSYEQVGSDYKGVNGLIGPDIHELNTPESSGGKTFIQDIYQTRNRNLSIYAGPEDGYILDGCFQEVDIVSHEVAFQWCSLDVVAIDETYVYLPDSGNYTIPGLVGTGEKGRPWDWFHINAIDRNTAGDYLISARHLSTIYHVAGKKSPSGLEPGQVIWRLGGKLSNFTMEGNLNFSAQHTIRFVDPKSKSTDSSMVVVLFDNAADGHSTTAETSSGKILHLDLEKNHASLVKQYDQPDGLIANDQGNMQLLPNGNTFLGWGHCNFFSEHLPSGEAIYYAQYGGPGDCEKGDDTFFTTNYRAWRFPWVGRPKTKPKALAYASACDAETYAYASWNGATEVKEWAFYVSNSTQPSDFKHAVTVPRKGFETSVQIKERALYMYAVALSSSKETLGTSDTTLKFVPTAELRDDCGLKSCEDSTVYHIPTKNRVGTDCVPDAPPPRPEDTSAHDQKHKHKQQHKHKQNPKHKQTHKQSQPLNSLEPDLMLESMERWSCAGLSVIGCIATLVRDWIVEYINS